ncbi:MAG: NTP transferase domain-containing protein [Bacilli bacterium]|nr:NTP transferase domain-containing protein [Bacilli bacterium]
MEAIILAAGDGKRMGQETPKILLEIDGIPMIKRVLNAFSTKYTKRKIIVVKENFNLQLNDLVDNITYAYQMVPLGTMDAYIQALPYVSSKEVIVVPSDIPFLDQQMIEDIIGYYYQNNIRNLMIGMKMLNPYSFGRIVTKNKNIKIIEQCDCNNDELNINIVNTGIYIFHVEDVYQYLPNMNIHKENNEYYLTDFVNYLSINNMLDTLIFPENYKLKGVNDQNSLANLLREKKYENTFKKNY